MVSFGSASLIQLGLAGVVGVSVATILYATRDRVVRVYEHHCRRVIHAWSLFTPDPVEPGRVVLAIYAGYLLAMIVLLAIVPALVFAVGLWGAALFLPGIALDYAVARRRKRIDRQLPEAIGILANCARSGLTLVQSIARVAHSAPSPVRIEFQIMANRYRHGANLEQTIEEAKARLSLESFNLFASAILVNREMGGDVVTTLDRIAQSLIKLATMRRTIEVHTSEGRMNIKVLVAAPVLMLLLLSTVDSEGVGLLFSTPQGWAVLIVAGLLIGFGFFWATRIVRTPI